MNEAVVVLGADPQFEYFCKMCGQLRLSFDEELTRCGNCKSLLIVRGKLGELNKAQLKADHENEQV